MTLSRIRYRWGMVTGLVAVAILGLAGWYAFARSDTAAPEERSASLPAVRVEAPTTESVEETARYLATIEGRGDAALAFRVSGTIGAMYIEEGDAVAAGEPLAELAAPEVEARVERARTELARAEASLDHWWRERDIDERLYEKGAIPHSKLNQTQLSFTNAERQRDAAAAGLREAEHTAAAHTLKAPRKGTIGRIEREAGETVMLGQPVFQLNAGSRRLQIDVLASDRARGLHVGSPVRIEAPECRDAEGAVEQIETATRPPLESVRVNASIPEDCLTDHPSGSTVPVQIVLQRAEEATFVPLSAIDLRGETPRLFRIRSDRTVEAVSVELGLQTGELRQVTGPLQPDDRVVIAGASNLQPGMQVQVAGMDSTRQ